jgi:mono/diheme cytochrome c family protein
MRSNRYFNIKLTTGLVVVAVMFWGSLQAMAESEMITSGAALFSANCQTCHGPDGNGNGPVAETMILKPRDFALAAFKFDTDADWERGTDTDLENVIKQGTAVFGGSSLMPVWNHLSDDEVTSLIAYIRSLEK